MAEQKERQSSFGGGEFARTMWGRSDLKRYAIGARTLRNMFVRPHGSASNRPGTMFVGETRNSGVTRLVPFTFSNDDSIVLAFSDLRLRFYKKDPVTGLPGVMVAPPGDPGAGLPYEVVTPYTAADLPLLRMAQSGDLIVIVHPKYMPRSLKRLALTVNGGPNWSIGQFFTITRPDAPGLLQWVQPGTIFDDYAEDDSHKLKTWDWLVTAMNADGEESLPSPALTPNSEIGGVVKAGVVLYSDRPATLFLETGHIPAGATRLRWYRQRNGLPGWIADSSAAPRFGFLGVMFYDDGQLPAYDQTPPSGVVPYRVLTDEGTGLPISWNCPCAVHFVPDRIVFAGAQDEPGTVRLSKSSAYKNFDSYTIPKATDPIELTLASRRLEDIRHLILVGGRLLTLTASSEWVVGGAKNAPFSPLDIGAEWQGGNGCSILEPLSVGSVALFVDRAGFVRELIYDYQTDSFTGSDVSVYSSHLLKDLDIVSWARAARPFQLIWGARSDGALLALTYIREQEMVAWARSDISDGQDGAAAVESVCSVPEGTEDATYLVVRRTVGGVTRRYIERFASRQVTDTADDGTPADSREGVFLDASLTYRGAPATHFSGLAHLEGKQVVALADGQVVRTDAAGAPLVVVGGAVDLPLEDGASVVHVGLAFRSSFASLDSPTEKGRPKTVKAATVELCDSRGMLVGQALDRPMERWLQRTVLDGYGVPKLFTGAARIPVATEWNDGGAVAVVQDEPLPLTITGITREVEFGG